MRMVLFAAAASLTCAASVADASPLMPLVDDGSAPVAIPVAQGCGLGYSRGASGRCRSNQFGFGVPGARRYGYGIGQGYGYRPYRYGY